MKRKRSGAGGVGINFEAVTVINHGETASDGIMTAQAVAIEDSAVIAERAPMRHQTVDPIGEVT